MLIESTPIVAVPVNFSAQDVKPGAVAFASALQLISVGDIRTPSAVPVNFRSPGHVALNEPLADVEVCSLTVHLKSVHELGEGISEDEVQLPISELLHPAVGDVRELWRSRLVQPATAVVTTKTMSRSRFFIGLSRLVIGADFVPG